MDNQGTPLLTEIIPKYEGIYPPETIEVVYRYLRDRIVSLTPLVEANKRVPLITAIERESCERGKGEEEIEKRSKNNTATKKVLADCEVAWQKLVDGTAHLCTECGGKIDKDRKQAVPAAGRCKECQEKIGLLVF